MSNQDVHDKSIHLTINEMAYVCQCCVQLVARSKLKWKVSSFKAIRVKWATPPDDLIKYGYLWICSWFVIQNWKKKIVVQTSIALINFFSPPFCSFIFFSSLVKTSSCWVDIRQKMQRSRYANKSIFIFCCCCCFCRSTFVLQIFPCNNWQQHTQTEMPHRQKRRHWITFNSVFERLKTKKKHTFHCRNVQWQNFVVFFFFLTLIKR